MAAALGCLGDDDLLPHRLLRDSLTWLLENEPVPSPAKFLDYGCGAGHYSQLLERYFPGRFSYVGADASPGMVGAARRLWPDHAFVVDDIENSQIDLGAFDVVCASGLVDVLENWAGALGVLLGSSVPVVLLHRQRIASRSYSRRVKTYGRRGWMSFVATWDLDRIASDYGYRVAWRIGYPLEQHHTFVIVRS